MKQEEYLKRIHEEILNIMDAIVKVCEDNGLHYYIIGGTLLGAVRHGGFIPWDDDLDIVMPRTDFNRFIEIANNQLDYPYHLDWIDNNKKYLQIIAKVRNTKTLFQERLEFGDTLKAGIFVDIFPIDETNGYSKMIEVRRWLVTKVHNMIFYKNSTSKDSVLKNIITLFLSREMMFRLCDWLMTMNNGKEGKYYSNFGSQYKIEKQTMPKTWYAEGIKIPFEDRMYYAPKEYKKVLKSIFGNNYMQLPPIEKRRSHYPMKVRFSDGIEIIFDQPANKINVE